MEWVCKNCKGTNLWQNFEVQSSGWKNVKVSDVDGEPVVEVTGFLEQNYDSDATPEDYECECGATSWDIAKLVEPAYPLCPRCKEDVAQPNEFCTDHRPLIVPSPAQDRLEL